MSKLLDSGTFGDKIYDRFPEVYKKDDVGTNYALKRYIEATNDGGFKYVIDEINGITNLRDSSKIPKEFLPVIFSSHGLEIFNGIPETFLRNLVPMLNELFSRKGSFSTIEYLCSVVSGVRCKVDTSNFMENHRVNVIVEMDYNTSSELPNVDQLRRITDEFIPFYCNTTLVFDYTFIDKFSILMRDNKNSDKIMEKTKDTFTLNANEVFEDKIFITNNENIGLENDSYKEDSCFLNSTMHTLTNNIFLNSGSGYDIITVNGNSELRTYNKEV